MEVAESAYFAHFTRLDFGHLARGGLRSLVEHRCMGWNFLAHFCTRSLHQKNIFVRHFLRVLSLRLLDYDTLP
jgi:hypothetical protein